MTIVCVLDGMSYLLNKSSKLLDSPHLCVGKYLVLGLSFCWSFIHSVTTWIALWGTLGIDKKASMWREQGLEPNQCENFARNVPLKGYSPKFDPGP